MHKKGFSNSFLRDTRISVNHSRISDINSHRSNNSRVNTSFDLLDSSLVDISLEQQPILPTSYRSHIAERKMKSRRSDHAKRNYLHRVLTNRMINVRLALKKMEDIPRALFRKGANFDIAKDLILKAKVSLQTSLIRTLLYSYQDSRKDQGSKLRLERGSNTFVTATSAQTQSKEREALQFLNALLKDHIRFCLKQFRLNHLKTVSLRRYFSKMCSNFQRKRYQAFINLKLIPDRATNKGVDQKQFTISQLLSILQKINAKESKLVTEALSFIKSQSLRVRLGQQYAAKTMIAFSKIRKEHAFYLWLNVSIEGKEKDLKKIKIEEEKLAAVKRIVLRNYFKLFMQINRRILTFRKVAVRLGCSSRINQQKALWRLLVNANQLTKGF